MQDRNIAGKIVRTLRLQPKDQVLEIGPGPGALTSLILACEPARLVLVEKDAYWARERMREGLRQSATVAHQGYPVTENAGKGAFSVILADALVLPWERFTSPWKIIGNLPYNVASPLMWDIFSLATGLVRAVFMIQKEVGQRITAAPGSSAYGALSVWIQSHMRAKLEFIVPPQVFKPRPKVDSAVVSFEPLRSFSCDGDRGFEAGALSQTLKLCFQMRRKQLGTILRAGGASFVSLEALGIDPKARPENLAPAEFHRLSRAMFPRQAACPSQCNYLATVQREEKELNS